MRQPRSNKLERKRIKIKTCPTYSFLFFFFLIFSFDFTARTHASNIKSQKLCTYCIVECLLLSEVLIYLSYCYFLLVFRMISLWNEKLVNFRGFFKLENSYLCSYFNQIFCAKEKNQFDSYDAVIYVETSEFWNTYPVVQVCADFENNASKRWCWNT